MNRLIIVLIFVYINHVGSIPEPRRSLVFVFDTTGSMFPELDQVKRGASSILRNLSSPNSQHKLISNYIFSPFNDPDVGPIVSTVNPSEFERTIQDVSVIGGGDCPELSLTALMMGIEKSSDKSHVFVFTDADPKDNYLFDNVTSLIRQKQCQIVFLLTGACNQHVSYEYEQISTISSGQIFNLAKEDIKQILSFIHSSFLPNQICLLSIDFAATRNVSCNYTYSVNVDETVSKLIISISGKNLQSKISYPNEEGTITSLKKQMKLCVLVNLTTAQIFEFENPISGVWNISVSSFITYSIRSIGSSPLNFYFGFSLYFTQHMEETKMSPVKGIENYILINSTSIEIIKLTSCNLISSNGTILDEVLLIAIENSTSLFYGYFTPKNDDFRIQINGVTKEGEIFKRLTIPTLKSDEPIFSIDVPKRVSASVNSTISLSCQINSSKSFTALWKKDGNIIISKLFNQNSSFSLNILNMSWNDAGNYSCFIICEKIVSNKTTVVDVYDKPVIQNTMPPIIHLKPHDDFILNCIASGSPKPKINWLLNDSKIHFPLDINSNIFEHLYLLPNGSLLFSNILTNYSGKFSCFVENQYGSDIQFTEIVVEGWNISKIEKRIDVLIGENIILVCPGLKNFQWKKNENDLDLNVNLRADQPRYVFAKGKKIFKIKDVEESDSGNYSCIFYASEMTMEYYFFILRVIVPLTFTNNQDGLINITSLNQSQVTFDCSIESASAPMVVWKKYGTNFPVNNWSLDGVKFDFKKQILIIEKVNSFLHSGVYECLVYSEYDSTILKKEFILNS